MSLRTTALGVPAICVRLFILLLGLAAARADDLALALKAQGDFDRVALTAVPQLGDVVTCEQSQAALLAVAVPEQVSLIRYRKGYCTAVEAALTNNHADFSSSASEFQQAIRSWPGTAGPVSSGLRALAVIAVLESGAPPDVWEAMRHELADALEPPVCPSAVMSPAACQDWVAAGRLWLGWIDYRRGDLRKSARLLELFPESGWPEWIAGLQALQARRYPESVPLLKKAVGNWAAARYPPPGVRGLLSPKPDLADAWYELGLAQFLSGETRAALPSLDAAVKGRPANAAAIFLRARAKDAVSLAQAAQADYDLAARTAFAESHGGDAHFYRAVGFFARLNYERAEDEFASALNFAVDPALKPDVSAWRALAATAGGSCGSSARQLEAALGSATDLFPRALAEARLRACRARP